MVNIQKAIEKLRKRMSTLSEEIGFYTTYSKTLESDSRFDRKELQKRV